MKEFKMRVYIDNGVVFTYKVKGESSVREHADAIAKYGYRHNDGKIFEHYPAHRIVKVKVNEPVQTNYPDETEGT